MTGLEERPTKMLWFTYHIVNNVQNVSPSKEQKPGGFLVQSLSVDLLQWLLFIQNTSIQ